MHVTIRRVQVTRTYKRETFGCRKLLITAWWWHTENGRRGLFATKNHRPSIASLPGPKIPIFYKKKYFFKIFFITKNPNAIIVLTI
jgi:hypothetical protein